MVQIRARYGGGAPVGGVLNVLGYRPKNGYQVFLCCFGARVAMSLSLSLSISLKLPTIVLSYDDTKNPSSVFSASV